MTDGRSRFRLQQAVAVTMRALSARPARSGGASVRPAQPAAPPLPDISSPPQEMALACWRGAADAAALRLKTHDPALHARLRPASRGAADLFDLLEEARALAAGSRHLPGTQSNLSVWLTDRCRAELPAQEQRKAGLLCAAWHQFVARPSPASDITIPEQTLQDLASLRGLLTDQQAFAARAKTVARAHARFLAVDAARPADLQLLGHQSVTDLLFEQSANDAEPAPPPAVRYPPKRGRPPPVRAATLAEPSEYRIFTQAFDETVEAATLASEDEFSALRRRLDRRLAPWQPFITRLALRLERRLLGWQRRGWVFEQEDGILDNRALPHAVARPDYDLIYKRETASSFPDTQVCLLIDNSGSMRGPSVGMAAMCSDILVRVLERCAIRCEVLGYTTRDATGGRSFSAWEEAGRPPRPGRLTDLRHIIYKSAATPYRYARHHLALMLDDRLLQENIDGEALEWARQRLRTAHAERKVLIVISDGAPCDPVTQQFNPPDLLDRHLLSVIRHIQEDPRIDLLAIGIRHNVGRYYSRAVTLHEINELGDVLFEQLSQVLMPQAQQRS